MPRKHTAHDPAVRLAGLPRLPDLVLAGDVRPLGTYVLVGRDIVQPRLALWMDVASGFVRAFALVTPPAGAPRADARSDHADALSALAEACAQPIMPGLFAPNGVSLAAPAGKRGKRGKAPKLPHSAPGLPARVLVADAALADAARALLEPFGVPVEPAPAPPGFDRAFAGISEAMGADPDAPPPQPFAWEVEPALLPSLYKAAAALWRRAPWEELDDHPPLAVELGAHGPDDATPTLYVSVLGALGQVYGVACYYSANDFRQAAEEGASLPALPDELANVDVAGLEALLRQAGAPLDVIPPEHRDQVLREALAQVTAPQGPVARQNSLALLFDSLQEADPTYLLWMQDRALKSPARDAIPTFLRAAPDADPRAPNDREVRALTLALDALNRFFSYHARSRDVAFAIGEPVARTLPIKRGGEKIPVTITFPAPGFALEEPDFDPLGGIGQPMPAPLPADPAARTTLYRFKVELKEGLVDRFEDVWRRIELRGDHTLHDLHLAIQRAFKFGDDHLYSFFLSNRAWDSASQYSSPYGKTEGDEDERDSLYPLADLPLKARKRFLYLFDYGDDWRFTITTEAITPGGVQHGTHYPRVAESHGKAPPQYPNWDEE